MGKDAGRSGVQLEVKDLILNFDGVQALSEVSFQVAPGEVLTIIGPKGAGKTCVLNCVSGFYRPQKGEITFEGIRITHMPAYRIPTLGIARTFQSMQLYAGISALDNLMAARHIHLKPRALASAIFLGPERRKEILQRRVVEDIIDLLEIKPIRKKIVGSLPYGQQKRVDLGRARRPSCRSDWGGYLHGLYSF